MVSSETMAAIDIVLFGFALVPILFLGLTEEIGLMIMILVALLLIRIAVQFLIKERITPARKVSKHLKLDQWSYNAMFLSAGGAIAIVFGFDGGLVTTAIVGIPVLILWKIVHYYLYADREKYYPNTQKIGDDSENNNVF